MKELISGPVEHVLEIQSKVVEEDLAHEDVNVHKRQAHNTSF